MSLLLQALQKAAKNREAAGTEEHDKVDAGPAAALGTEPHAAAGELSLAEDDLLFGDEREEPKGPVMAQPARDVDTERPRGKAGSAPSPFDASMIVRANEARSAGWIDRIRDRPVHAFAIAAGIFGTFYAGYVYLQIAHPGILRGDFLRTPSLQARTPPPAPVQPLPPSPPATTAAAPIDSNGTKSASSGHTAGPVTAPASTTGASEKAAVAAPAPSGTTKPEGAPAQHPIALPPGRSSELDDGADAAAPPKRTRQPRVPRTSVPVESATLDDSVAVKAPDNRYASVNQGVARAWDALQQGRYEEARTLYQEAADADPQNVDAILGLAAIASQQGNADLAGRLFGRALELEPRNTAAQAGLIAIIGQADPQLSESRLKQLIAREPTAFAYFALGNLYAQQAKWAPAQQAYFQAYQLQPDNPDYAYNLAIGLEHLNQPKIALNYYRRAIELATLKGRASFDRQRVEERIGQLAARVGSQ